MLLNKNEIKKNSLTVLPFSAFIVHLFISSISNYSNYSFVLKGLSTVFIVIIMIIHSHIYKNNLKVIYINNSNKSLFTILILVIVLPVISLTYSLNNEFGGLKILALAISTIPTILIFLYLIKNYTQETTSLFFHIVITAAVISSIYVIVTSPFSYRGGYQISFFNWSHVIFGRYISSSLMIISLLIIYKKNVPTYLKISFLISTTGLVFAQFRGGLVSLILILILMLFIKLFINNNRYVSISRVTVMIITILVTTGIYYIFESDSRYKSMVSDLTQKSYTDGPIHARELAYKYSLESIMERPLLGAGAGGFYSETVGKDVYNIKYPHNIILEIAVEYGLVATILFIIFLIKLFIIQWKFNPAVFYFFLFTFMLALFSKDLPNQPVFLIGMVFLSSNNTKESRNKH